MREKKLPIYIATRTIGNKGKLETTTTSFRWRDGEEVEMEKIERKKDQKSTSSTKSLRLKIKKVVKIEWVEIKKRSKEKFRL